MTGKVQGKLAIASLIVVRSIWQRGPQPAPHSDDEANLLIENG
jgi:hypothetical protein